MVDRKTLESIVLDRLMSLESTDWEKGGKFYRDAGRNHVLTIGIGYTPIVKGEGGRWRLRKDVEENFRAAGVPLSTKHINALRAIEAQMNAATPDTATIEQAIGDLGDVHLDPEQQTALARPALDEAVRHARNALGADVFDHVRLARQAEFTVGAYQSPRAIAAAGPDLATAIRKGDWEAVAKRWEAIGRELHDPKRYHGGAAILRDPSLKGMVTIAPGDSLSAIARSHGTTVEELIKANSHLDDPDSIRAGDVLHLPSGHEGANPSDAGHGEGRGEPAAPVGKHDGAGDEKKSDAGASATPVAFRTEDARALHRAVVSDAGVHDLLRKPPERLTDGEVRRLADARVGLGDGDPAKAELFRHEQGFYRAIYGDGPQRRDETGRPLPPVPVRAPASRPEPLRTADGGPLAAARRHVADGLAAAADRHGAEAVVRDLQQGLNGWVTGRAGHEASPPLKVDGLFGPRTRRRLDDALLAGIAGGFAWPRRTPPIVAPSGGGDQGWTERPAGRPREGGWILPV